MKSLYVGDIGEIPQPYPYARVPDIDLDGLTERQLFSLALEAGVKLKDIIGIDDCFMHNESTHVVLGANSLPSGFTYLEHVVYCRNCFVMYRKKRK